MVDKFKPEFSDDCDDDPFCDKPPPLIATAFIAAGFASLAYICVDSLSHMFDAAKKKHEASVNQKQVVKDDPSDIALNGASVKISDDGVVVTPVSNSVNEPN